MIALFLALLIIIPSGMPGAQEPAASMPAADSGFLVSMEAEAAYRAGSLGEEIVDRGLSPHAVLGLGYESTWLDILARVRIGTDGKYGAMLADIGSGSLGSVYMFMEEGGLRARLGSVELEAGRFSHYDVVDSPYALFENPGGGSAPTMSLSFEHGNFFYKSRWLGLNLDSAVSSDAYPAGFPDRGASIKVIGYRHGEMRFGFQDAVVYSGRWFDYEYFLSPMPMYATQYMRGTGGAPWAASYDDNAIMGAFWDWTRPRSFHVYAQALLDDFGLPSFLGGPDNPWQMAASLGGHADTALGILGFHGAMATKYTFEPSNAPEPYGYSYYPETQYTSYWQDGGTRTRAIAIEDNEIGYKHGENNLAFSFEWQNVLRGYDLGAALEFRLAGSNSPANPGHDAIGVPSAGTRWLDDAVLEKRMMLTAGVSRPLGDVIVYGSLACGVAFDALELRPGTSIPTGTADSIFIYSPVAGNTKYLFQIRIGTSYRLDRPNGD